MLKVPLITSISKVNISKVLAMGFRDKLKNALASDKKQNEDFQSQNDNEIESETSRSFKYLYDLIHSGVRGIVLNSDVVLSDFEESQYADGIRIDVDDLVIDGNGHSIDARGKAGIFYCSAKNVTIKNIILKNAEWAIHNKGDLTLIESVLTGNVSEYETIFNSGVLTIADTTISNNNLGESRAVVYNSEELVLTGSTITQNRGNETSVIYNYEGKVTIADTTISKNVAERDGSGAISNAYGEITITGTKFCENIRKDDGLIRNSQGTMTIEGSTFEKNATSGTAMIQNDGGESIRLRSIFGRTAEMEDDEDEFGKLNIYDSTFAENTMQNGELIDNHYGILTLDDATFEKNVVNNGSVIKNRKGQFKIFDSTFTGNSVMFNIVLNVDSIQVISTDFMANSSRFILYNSSDEYDFGIDACKFLENDVEETVICNDGKSFTISKATFKNSLHDSRNIINEGNMKLTDIKMKDEGKSILNEDYLLLDRLPNDFEDYIENNGIIEFTMPPFSFKHDFGYLDRIIHESETGEILLEEDIRLETYERDFYEGGMELDIDGLVIDGNGRTIEGADKSRIFIVTAKNVTLKNITFTKGHSHRNYDNPLNSDGGALKVNANAGLTVVNCRFVDNTSENCAGTIQNNRGELTVKGTVIDENTADVDGAIRNNCGRVTIDGCEFNGNVGKYECGAVGNNGGQLDIIDCKFRANMSKGSCGAIKNSKGWLTIGKCEIIDNNAMSEGAIWNQSEMCISGSTISKNSGNDRFGSRYGAISNEGNLTIVSTLIAENVSNVGGAIVNDGAVDITDSTLTKNTAKTSDGGAIHNSGTAKITNTVITENDAEEYGGAISNNGRLEIIGGRMSQNSSKKAGAIFNQDLVVIEKTLLDENDSINDASQDIFNMGKLVLKMPEFKTEGKTILNQSMTCLYRGLEDRIQNDNGELVYMDFADNQRNFSYLDTLIQSGQKEISLDFDIILDVSILEDEKYSEGIPVGGDDVTIDGNGHMIDAKNLVRIFRTAGKGIVMKNLTIKNGHSYDGGGAIHNDGDLTLIESGIIENVTDGQDGGAIRNHGALTIRDCVIDKNRAEYGDGGAVYNEGSLNILKSQFAHNFTSRGHGGAIYNMKGETTITESSFLKNISNKQGGAINNFMGNLKISESEMIENRARITGGAINNDEGELTIVKSQLTGNIARSYGGAIYLYHGKSSITGSEIANNEPDNVFEEKDPFR